MPTNVKTKAERLAQRKSQRSHAAAPVTAIELLEKDHREVARYFEDYNGLQDGNAKAELAEKICTALKIHTQIEEEIFYPQAREITEDNNLLDEALVEHDGAKKLIAEIESMEVGDDLYDAKIKVLGEQIKQHVKEEEEELFPECESAKMDLVAVGRQLATRKTELMAQSGMILGAK